MQLPQEAKNVIARFAERFGVPQTYDAGQPWTHRVAEQLAFSFPGQGYMHKSAGPGRPHSSDVVARQVDGKLIGWDLIVGLGSVENPGGRLDLNGESIDLSGQIPEPVQPVNHLGDPLPDPQPQPDPQPVPGKCACEAQLAEILAELKWQRKAVESGVEELKKGAAILQSLGPQFLALIAKGIIKF